MVHYFRTRCSTYQLYMGKDKYENEELIKYGWPEDVWFHVDDLSSAHVYLRMKPGQTLSDIPEDVLLDCCSLVKANSIAGCKVSFVFLWDACVCVCCPLLFNIHFPQLCFPFFLIPRIHPCIYLISEIRSVCCLYTMEEFKENSWNS